MQFCRRGICVNSGCAKSPRQPVARGSPWPRAVLAHIAHRPIRSSGARPGPSRPKRDQSANWLCLLAVSTGSAYWPCLLAVYWLCLLAMSTGCVYWPCLLALSTGCAYWPCLLARSNDSIYWLCLLVVSPSSSGSIG